MGLVALLPFFFDKVCRCLSSIISFVQSHIALSPQRFAFNFPTMSVTAETNGGVVTSWIPLTTVFTPPSGCESSFRFVGSLLAFASNYGGIANKCVAPAVTSWWEQVDRDGSTITSIQPLTCPYLWTTATTVVTDSTSTQIMCCPS